MTRSRIRNGRRLITLAAVAILTIPGAAAAANATPDKPAPVSAPAKADDHRR